MNETHYYVSRGWVEFLVEWNSEAEWKLYKSYCNFFLWIGSVYAVQMTTSLFMIKEIKSFLGIYIGYGAALLCFVVYFALIKKKPYKWFYKKEIDYVNKLLFEDAVRQEVNQITEG